MFLQHVLEQSLAFLPLTLGVFLSFVVLKTADLTVDGSFVLGAGLFARLVRAGVSPVVAMGGAILAGCLAGVGVSLMQRRGRISPLIAGILALFILQSLNLLLMGQPNLSLLGYPTALGARGVVQLATLALLGCVVLGGMVVLLRSRLGLHLRAFGSNATLLKLMARPPERYRMIGLATSNGLVALSGALTAQMNGYADLAMGTGVVLIGLGTVIIGMQLAHFFGRGEGAPLAPLAGAVVGVVVYFTLLASLVEVGLPPVFLKMTLGLALVALLLTSQRRLMQEVLA